MRDEKTDLGRGWQPHVLARVVATDDWWRGSPRGGHSQPVLDTEWSSPGPGAKIELSHWSSSCIAGLSLVESSRVLKYLHALKGPIIGALSVATPAILCHKEPARRIQSPLLGALERKIPPTRGILLAPRWFFMA